MKKYRKGLMLRAFVLAFGWFCNSQTKQGAMSKQETTKSTDVKLFLCGDVMTGRGIDQALPHSVDPVLYM